jgi:hypothetical protein
MNFLADYAVKVRTHYNALAPMDRVPDDVLLQILYLLSPSAAFDADVHNFIPKHVLVSTHVCRRWRTLVLNSPTFWSAPLFRWSPDAATTTLGRAKDAPLKVSLTLRKKHYSIINEMFRRLPTIKYLKLDGQAAMLEHYLTHFSHPAPQLEVLKLACPNLRNPSFIPSTIFSGDAPRLRTVELTNCAFAADCALLANVTQLTLVVIFEFPRLVTLHALLQTLEHAPRLEHFAMTDAFIVDSFLSGPSAVGAPVTLPRMQTFELRDYIFCITEVLRRISVPCTASIRVLETIDPDAPLPPEDMEALFAHLGGGEHLTKGVKVLGMDLENEGNVFSCRVRTQEHGVSPQLCVALNLDEEQVWEGVLTASGVFVQIAHGLPFTDVVTLHVRELDDWDDPALLAAVRHVLPQLGKLRTLHLGGLAVGGFLCGLSGFAPGDPGECALPQLAQLHLERLDLMMQADESDNAPSMLTLLGQFLTERRGAGGPPLAALFMWRCLYAEIDEPAELAQHFRQNLGDNVAQIEASNDPAPFPRWT